MTLDSGITFFEAHQQMQKRLESDDKHTKEIKEELYGMAQLESMPFDLQIEMARNKLNIAPHIWEEYDTQTKGRCIASNSISNQLESYERFESIQKRNRKKTSNA